MQRLLMLAMLSALLGGGYMFTQGMSVGDLQKVVSAGKQAAQQYSSNGQGGGQPAYQPQSPPPMSPSAAGYVPSQPAAGSTIRIGSYNIEKFGDKKASNPYVMRTLGAIVKNLDLVAIQEITTQDEYFIDKFLEQYVNNTGRRYSRVVGPRLGRSSYKEQYAILYDTNTIEFNPQLNYTLQDYDDLLHREPLVAMFRARAAPNPDDRFSFVIINAHTDPDETAQEFDALAQAYLAVQRSSVIGGQQEDDIILLGDLNTNVPAASPYRNDPGSRSLRPSDLGGLGRLSYLYPVIRNQATNTSGSKLNDNLLIHRGATVEFTGRSGVIDVQGVWGLSPDQAQLVSDHLPVWAEFSVFESGAPGRMATRPVQPTR
ncbi:Endonuclease/Exonuclease/phosphatase family protein [Posidoniimonas polymericola]|uniref:Endonuclease/Exonuclease/phosphatase family protein n=1 Tax=Posidoniimonas polymericola TaxID=2528002 RepID=A0A5C5ZEU9_9BACT|nr:endonuclease/exonuclease/phosphatase family protein [Posidoniimonas polymericola]TWT85567.1 Endonuclease/Exonuclease/phosphatase family protein [Posidoniimonas polymericola]